jgi:hypothetical protein
MAPKFQAVTSYKTLATHVFVGMGAASFWRGAWYILDDHLFPDNAAQSAAASLGLGAAGMAASQGLLARAERLAEKLKQSQSKITKANLASSRTSTSSIHKAPLRLQSPKILQGTVAVARFGVLYTVAISCVLVWRGTWVGWDVLYENVYLRSHPENPKSTDRGHATHSGLLSHAVAVGLLMGTGLFASVLAPPAAVSVLRDFAVKTGSTYTGPAQIVADRLFGSGSVAASQRTLSTPTVASTTARSTTTSFHNSSKAYRPTTSTTSTAAAVKQQQQQQRTK